MNRIIWRRIGRQPTFRKLTISFIHSPYLESKPYFDGNLYALDETGRLFINQNYGLDGAWQWCHDLPADVINLTCAAGVIYFQTADRSLWSLSDSGDAIRVGRPWAAAEIAGTEGIMLGVPILWALNDDKTLWRNGDSGDDGQWKKIGLPHGAWKIAAARNMQFALNTDDSLWANSGGGADDSWKLIGMAPGAVEITAATDGQTDAIQLYALHHDFSLWQGVIVSKCQVSLTTQNTYPVSNPHADWSSLVDLDECGVTTNVWTMGGHALHVNRGDKINKFLNYSETDIREKLTKYLAKYPEINNKDLVILDMEHPVHPASLGKPDYADRIDDIIKAFKARIRIVRRKLPQAKLALYGVIVPEGQGNSDKQTFRDRMDGYRRAATSGLFDEIDYLTPVLYTRWGSDDACGRKHRLRFCSFAAYNRMGFTETAKLIDKPIVPILNLKVSNRQSNNDHQKISAEMARSQLAYLQAQPEVARVVYWVPPRPSNVKGNYSTADEILLFFYRLNACGRTR